MKMRRKNGRSIFMCMYHAGDEEELDRAPSRTAPMMIKFVWPVSMYDSAISMRGDDDEDDRDQHVLARRRVIAVVGVRPSTSCSLGRRARRPSSSATATVGARRLGVSVPDRSCRSCRLTQCWGIR